MYQRPRTTGSLRDVTDLFLTDQWRANRTWLTNGNLPARVGKGTSSIYKSRAIPLYTTPWPCDYIYNYTIPLHYNYTIPCHCMYAISCDYNYIYYTMSLYTTLCHYIHTHTLIPPPPPPPPHTHTHILSFHPI